MAILQALISVLSRSLGKILNAIFGWAVLALFGQTSSRQRTILSGLVALAALWPLLVVGVVIPRIATAVLAFVPPSAQGPEWLMRLIWSVLALGVPIAVGLTVASKSPPGSPREPFFKKTLRGFPITLGLAAAFLIVFVSVPILRFAALVRKLKDEHVPLVTSADAYADVAARLDDLFVRREIDVTRADPPWWLDAPTAVLRKLGGRALRGFVPERPAYWHGPRLEVALHPSDLLLRGARSVGTWAHGLIVEELTDTPALQTFDPVAQELEQRIRRIWSIHDENPAAHDGSVVLRKRVSEIVETLGKIDVTYEEWSILYRQCAQLSRAIEGRPQLLAKEAQMSKEAAKESATENETEGSKPTGSQPEDPSELSSTRLMGETAREAIALIKAQVELAKTELKEDLRSEMGAVKGLSLGLVCALCGLNLLLVLAAYGLAQLMPVWAALLAVAGVMFLVAAVSGALGYRRVRVPLQRTRKSLEEDVRWVKERTA